MKALQRPFFYLILLFPLLFQPVTAQEPTAADEPEAAADVEAEEEKPVSIAKMLKDVEYVTKVRPKKKVHLYFFLRSRSNCGFCVRALPREIELYKEMKGKGAELIMLNCDTDTATAKAWVEKSEVNFPVITPETSGQIKVPAGGSGGTPNVVAILPDGTFMEGMSGANGSSDFLAGWKELLKDAKKMQREKKAEKKKKARKKKARKDAEAEAI